MSSFFKNKLLVTRKSQQKVTEICTVERKSTTDASSKIQIRDTQLLSFGYMLFFLKTLLAHWKAQVTCLSVTTWWSQSLTDPWIARKCSLTFGCLGPVVRTAESAGFKVNKDPLPLRFFSLMLARFKTATSYNRVYKSEVCVCVCVCNKPKKTCLFASFWIRAHMMRSSRGSVWLWGWLDSHAPPSSTRHCHRQTVRSDSFF